MADESLPQTKTCTKCGETKPLTEFWRDRRKSDGRTPACRACMKASHSAWIARNPDYANEWQRQNRDKANAAKRRHRERHPEKAKEVERRRVRDPAVLRKQHKAYYEANKERLKHHQRQWYAKNAERARLFAVEWRRKNRQHIIARQSLPKARLDGAVSRAIRARIAKGSKRRAKWETLVGYSINQLMAHLERQFLPGMTWENYGLRGWHIDHIVPLSAFNYETPDHIDFKRAWALSNLRPLWARDNISKGGRLSAPFQPSLAI
jgi:hypothetical protein